MNNNPSKTHYDTLEIDENATLDDIKKAYRRLAKIHHPDVTGGSSSTFGIILEAYETLSDEVKRGIYDRQRTSSNQYSGFNNPGFNAWGFENLRMYHQKMNPDVKAAISINMGQAYAGFSSIINFDRQVECTECFGTGKCNKNTCKKCNGAGKFQSIGSVEIKVLPRTMSGTRVVIPGAGNVMSDGTSGNLEISVQYIGKSEGVLCSIDGTLFKDIIVPWEAALLEEDFSFKVFSNCKESVLIKLDSKTSNGGQQRLVGLGMANRDLVIKVWYSLPSNIEYKDRKRIAKAIKRCQTQKETKKEPSTSKT